jgi:hypothetical protein
MKSESGVKRVVDFNLESASQRRDIQGGNCTCEVVLSF